MVPIAKMYSREKERKKERKRERATEIKKEATPIHTHAYDYYFIQYTIHNTYAMRIYHARAMTLAAENHTIFLMLLFACGDSTFSSFTNAKSASNILLLLAMAYMYIW